MISPKKMNGQVSDKNERTYETLHKIDTNINK